MKIHRHSRLTFIIALAAIMATTVVWAKLLIPTGSTVTDSSLESVQQDPAPAAATPPPATTVNTSVNAKVKVIEYRRSSSGGRGARGNTGRSGRQGLKGNKGDKGDPGLQGLPGRDGRPGQEPNLPQNLGGAEGSDMALGYGPWGNPDNPGDRYYRGPGPQGQGSVIRVRTPRSTWPWVVGGLLALLALGTLWLLANALRGRQEQDRVRAVQPGQRVLFRNGTCVFGTDIASPAPPPTPQPAAISRQRGILASLDLSAEEATQIIRALREPIPEQPEGTEPLSGPPSED